MNEFDIDISDDTTSEPLGTDVEQDNTTADTNTEYANTSTDIVTDTDISNVESVSSNDTGYDAETGEVLSETSETSTIIDTSVIETLLENHNKDFNEFISSTVSENSVSGNAIYVTPSDTFSETLIQITNNQVQIMDVGLKISITLTLILTCLLFDIMMKSAKRIIGNMMSKPDEKPDERK